MDENVKVTPVSPGGYPPGGGYGGPPGGYPPPRRSGGCLGAWAVLATVGLGLSMFVNMVLVAAKGGAAGPDAGPTMLHEKVLEGEGEDKIAVIEIDGVIMDKPAGGLFGAPAGEGLVKRVKDQLEKAKKDEAVKAVLLAVDSPGGSVTASDQIHHELQKFRVESKKPLVVHQGALAASGGYYVSAPADEIIADTTTITGSIGVILGGGVNAHKFLKDHGFEEMTVTSGPNKDLLSMTGPPREEHKQILQATVDDMYERFVWVVAEGIARRAAGKNETADQKAIDEVMPAVKKLADGRIYTARQALDLKLITGIGYMEDAIAAAKKRANLTQAKVVLYKRQPTLMDVLSGNVESRFGGGVNVKIDGALIDELATPRALVLWKADR